MSRAKSRSSFSSFCVWRETPSDSIPQFFWLTLLLFLIDRFSSVTYAIFPSSSHFGSAWIWAPFSATSVWHIVITAISVSLFPSYSYKLQRRGGKCSWKARPLCNTREAVPPWKMNTPLLHFPCMGPQVLVVITQLIASANSFWVSSITV